MNCWLIVILIILATHSNGYKILFLAPFYGKSHCMYMQAFVRALLDRQHDVTFLTSHSLGHLNLENYTEVLIDPPFPTKETTSQEVLFNMATRSPFALINHMQNPPKKWNVYAFENENVQRLINSSDLYFDVIVNEEFFADSFLMFAHKFKAPIVTICSFGATEYFDQQMGLMTPLSFVPHWMLSYSDNMSFSQRWYNVIVSLYDYTVRKLVYLPVQEEFAKRYFAHLEPLPPLDDLLRSVSVVLLNTHRALSPPRPTMPGVINIGGAHLKPPKRLPNDLLTFLDESRDGVIYFSLGTVLNASQMPKEKIQIFLDVFRELKQRVLWKFENESLDNVPSNVLIRKWMPQNDILAHPKVKLFISHGGLFGTSESLYHGVPMVLIPFFNDQHRNAHRVVMGGYGKSISYGDLTKETLFKKINEIISNHSYMTKAKQISAVFTDNLVHPMDEAMFWIEHVAKFKGAPHLHSHAVNIPWFSYLLIDVILATVFAILAFSFAIYFLVNRILIFANTNMKHSSKKQD